MMADVPITWSAEPIIEYDHPNARLGDTGGLFRDDLPDGAARWADAPGGRHVFLNYVCPCGCKHARSISIQRGEGRGWNWDGNETAPTLTPSILHTLSPGTGNCGWHGWLTNGVFKTC